MPVQGWISSSVYIENFPQHDALDHADAYDAFVDKLRSYALDELTVMVLAARCFFSWTFREIADEFNIPSPGTAHYMFKRGVNLLRERGYK